MADVVNVLPDAADSRQAFKYLYKCWKLLGVYPARNCKFSYVPIMGFVATLPLTMAISLFYIEKFQEILFNLSVNVTFAACVVKYANVLLRRNTILEVNSLLKSLDSRAKSAEEQCHIRSAIRYANVLFKLTFVMFCGTSMTLEVGALWSRGERLMFSAWFPFDWQASSLNYLIAHMHQLIALGFDIFLNVSSDVYPAIYMHILTCHVRTLNMRVRRIGMDLEKTANENCLDLIQGIQDHQLLLQYFHLVETVTSIPIFIQFFVTGIEACITAVSVFFVTKSIIETTFLLVYFVCVIMEIFLYCYFGNELMNESQHLTEAIYSCNWMDQNRRFKSILIIFMQSTQKSMTIKAGGYVHVNAPTFFSVLRSSYSLFAVLMRVA